MNTCKLQNILYGFHHKGMLISTHLLPRSLHCSYTFICFACALVLVLLLNSALLVITFELDCLDMLENTCNMS